MFKYLYGLFILLFVSFVGFNIYKSVTKKDFKSSRFACQKEVVTIETFRKPKLIEEAISSLKNKNYKLISKIRFSKYMISRLGNYIEIADVDKMINNAISKYKSENNNKTTDLIIDYTLYENDKNDPGKKTAKSKLYAGYIYLNFKLNESISVYDIQIDYMNMEAKDLNSRIECAIKSFVNANDK